MLPIYPIISTLNYQTHNTTVEDQKQQRLSAQHKPCCHRASKMAINSTSVHFQLYPQFHSPTGQPGYTSNCPINGVCSWVFQLWYEINYPFVLRSCKCDTQQISILQYEMIRPMRNIPEYDDAILKSIYSSNINNFDRPWQTTQRNANVIQNMKNQIIGKC